MLRIALCDDEQEARDQLRFQLEKSLYETDEEIVYEFSSGETAVRWLKKHPGEIDLLFLDVEMKEMTGMEAAERIREFDKTILLVFVTGYSEYVFDGYRTGALDYVMKPAGGRTDQTDCVKSQRSVLFQTGKRFCVPESGGNLPDSSGSDPVFLQRQKTGVSGNGKQRIRFLRKAF